VLPNSWSPILVQVVILSSVAILLEAALAFLGIGIPPPTPSWGEMLRTGKSYLHDAPTYAVLPGLALTLTILLDALGRALPRAGGPAGGDVEGPRMTAYGRRFWSCCPCSHRFHRDLA
jgi:ABC-type dipeptide/oligopeptide/nickel transport system permease subunit